VIIFYSFYCRFKKSWISIHHGKVLIWFWRLLFVFVLPFLFVFAFVLSMQTIGKRFSSFCRCFIDSVEFKWTNSNFLPKFCSTQIIFLYLSWLMKRSFKKGLQWNEKDVPFLNFSFDPICLYQHQQNHSNIKRLTLDSNHLI